MRTYAAMLASAIDAPAPKSFPIGLARRIAPYLACVLDHTRLPVSNEKAKAALGWEPRHPTVEAAFSRGVA